jgi:hypothetical protein
MISKELLSRVLELNIILVDTKYTETTKRIRYVTSDNNDYYIDVYNLAHKCKEWAFEKGYELRTSIRGIIDVYDHIYIHKEDGLTGEFIDCRQEADTEVEAIFKACQWVSDNKEQK